MCIEGATLFKCVPTNRTSEWTFSCVDSLMFDQILKHNGMHLSFIVIYIICKPQNTLSSTDYCILAASSAFFKAAG